MKAADLMAKPVQELKSMILNHKKETFNLRMQKATGQLEKTHRLRVLRREVARILTVIEQKKTADNQAKPKTDKKGS